MPLPSLPVDDTLPELLRVLAEGPAAVLHAPTGAGKTTRVPPALLDAGYGDVLVLEPRRLAARAAARRIAFERGGRLGDEVGYHVRFDRQAGRSTRLCIMTEGILVRRLQDDPFLEGIGCIVFDEFHERGLDADLALAMARRVQESARDDLRIVVMSATLDTERVAGFLGDCPVVTSTGRLHPVEVRHLPARGREKLDVHITRGVEEVLEHTQGDVLAFLPGVGEIRRAHAALEGIARRSGRDILELYGDLPPERQDAVLRRGARPKLVLATNVAETSVTIEGVTGVVDSGLVRRMRYDTSVGLDRLELGNGSRASADQRTGRAGRTEPGVAVRLWSPMDERALAAHEEPEVRRVDLAGPALQLLCWGEADVSAFPWVEAPRAESLEQALELLARLGATQKGALTELGRRMGRLPIHPRLARMLIEGHERGVTGRAALAAALLSERDPFARRRGPAPDAAESDVLERVRALEDHERGRSHPDLNRNGARFVARAADQFARLAENVLGKSNARGGDEALLLLAQMGRRAQDWASMRASHVSATSLPSTG
ncbi:MAG TPA: ATP-dependent RNA helicase [Gemmatimonadetes bacterium]|nr:ATP-dependent RNA helicase [Gemmatimonadota bacterium]